jgi:hypothetical protein
VSDSILEMRADHTILVFNHSRNLRLLLTGIIGGMKTQWSLRLLWSGLLTDPGYPRGRGLGFLVLDQIEAYASLWVNLPQSFRLKYMPHYNVHMKYKKGL